MHYLMNFLKYTAMTTLTAVIAMSGLANAAILEDEKDIRWVSNRDLTSDQFAERFRRYSDQGYMMIDMDAYETSRGTRYAMIWRENTDGRGWAEHRGMTSARYLERWRQYRDQGFRPHDIETWGEGSNRRWAGIWVENREGLAWASYRGLTHDRYAEIFRERSRSGFRLLDMEAYLTSDGMRYTAIWVENRDNRDWAQLRNMTRESYQQHVATRSADGFRVVDYEAYDTGNRILYAAIWERKSGYAWQTRTNRSAVQFANLWRQYRDEGYRLVDFERTETRSGPRYAGIWAENAPRFRNSWKNTLNGLLDTYRTSNGFPGVSVAVIQNGSIIYRRGSGFADISTGKVAHGGTIYGLASISKAVGGTLAAMLEDEGRLQDGTTFSLNLNNSTSSFLTNIRNGNSRVSLPGFHTHTVAQLLAHLGCVVHYPSRTAPGINNQTSHFGTAVEAVQTLWNTGLVTDIDSRTSAIQPCLVGGNVGQTRSYSTHAHTFVGAVLERVTGRSIARLVDEEIADQFNLGTLRTMYSTNALPSKYDRTKPYRSTTTETNYSNNSWKVLGGGLEASAVDLARFGWKVLNGEIVDATARDCRMWVRVGNASRNGLGWSLGNSGNGRRIADHAGDAGGMDSYLRVYRDEGLVIAIMGNRDVNGSTRTAFADSIGNLILGTTVTPPTPVTCP